MTPAHRELSASSDPPSGLPTITFEEARRALAAGEFEVCLSACRAVLERDETVEARSVGEWDALREEALAAVRKLAEERRREGEAGLAARLLGLLLRFDARAANSVHLAWAAPPPSAEPPPGSRTEDPSPASPSGAAPTALGAAPRFRWAIDAAGEFLCLAVEEVFLAPGGGSAPRLIRRPALRGGGSWCLVAPSGCSAIDGRAPQRECTRLRSGSRVEIDATAEHPRISFTFRMDDPASHSARLELERGFEADEVQGILLLAVGRSGRVTVGSGIRSLVRCSDLESQLELWVEADELCVKPPRAGQLRDGRATGAEGRTTVEAGATHRMPWPLAGRCDLELPAPDRNRPPVWMRLDPLN